jgi:hypothetical protein
VIPIESSYWSIFSLAIRFLLYSFMFIVLFFFLGTLLFPLNNDILLFLRFFYYLCWWLVVIWYLCLVSLVFFNKQ